MIPFRSSRLRRLAASFSFAAALSLAAAATLLGTLGVPAPSSAQSPDPNAPFPRLEIRAKGSENAWVAYGDAPAIGFGPSPQNLLTCLPPGEARDPDLDFRDFAEWAFAHGVTIVRSYPPSDVVGPRYLDLFERAASDTSRFDLTRFNDAWYARLGEACSLLRAHGIFVHLQLWQAVTWKKEWDDCYYNPARNVNAALVKNAGPGAFVIDPKQDAALVAHQKEHVRRVLDATGRLGNVFYDLVNEIGNGTGVSGAWIEAMLDEVEAWESKNGLDVLVGLNDEGRDRKETAQALSNPRFDVAFLDSGRYDEHAETRSKLGKPTFGVRNVDWNPETRTREYFAGELDISLNPDRALASRTRRMFMRMFMAKSQMSAAYADWGRLAYRGPSLVALDLWPFQNLRRITTKSPWVDDFSGLRIASATEFQKGSPTPHVYVLDSPRLALVFFESTPGTAGVTFPATEIIVTPHLDMGKPEARFLHPATALWRPGQGARRGDDLVVQLPEFTDELLLVLFDSAEDPANTRSTIDEPLHVDVADGSVRLSWAKNHEGLIARAHRLRSDIASRGQLSDTPSLFGGTTGLSIVDQSPAPGEWMYTVVWKDDAKRQILQTTGVTVTVPDRAPFVPEVRKVRVDASRVKLWAAGNLDSDIARFEWEKRLTEEEPWAPIAGAEGAILEDVGLARGVPLQYRSRAFDATGQASEWSAPLSVTPEVRRMPVAPGTGIAKARSWVRRPLVVAATILGGLVLGVFWAKLARRRR